MKKLWTVMACLFIACTLFGCNSEDNEFKAMDALNQYMEKLMKHNIKEASAIYDADFRADQYDYIHANDLKTLMFSNLKYAIKGENYDSSLEQASLKVSITNTNYQEILVDAEDAITADPNNADLDEATRNTMIVKKAKELLKQADKETNTVQVVLDKHDQQFVISKDNDAFVLAIIGQESLEDDE